MDLFEIFLLAATLFFVFGTLVFLVSAYYLYRIAKIILTINLTSKKLISTLIQVRYATKAVILDKLIGFLKT